MLTIKLFAVNPFREVTYVVSDPTKECVVIDCGCSTDSERERIADYIARSGLKPILALNTHAHIDHITGIGFLQETYGVPFALHSGDQMILDEGPLRAYQLGFNASEVTIPTIDIDLSKLTEIKFGASTLQVIHTPGHTPGHVSFYSPADKVIFTGDTVFQESIGRTDLPGGDYDALMRSIITKILPLGGDVTIYPGHGNHTDIAHEAMYNPFIVEVLEGSVNKPSVECE